MTQMIKPSRVLHVGVLMTKEPVGETPNILRDTNGLPLWDTGYSILTAQPLRSGIKVTVKTKP